MSVAKGDYGPVSMDDRIGYYDDDQGQRAVVYFGVPFMEDYELVPRSRLELAKRCPALDKLARRAKSRLWRLDVVRRRKP